tara:strand:+ start:50 stop:241 length:192 start_codon:yes stop_codon:yes gene_type:complete
MKKFIKTKLGAFIVSSLLAFFLLLVTIYFGYNIADEGVWLKAIIMIPALILYSSLKSSNEDKS